LKTNLIDKSYHTLAIDMLNKQREAVQTVFNAEISSEAALIEMREDAKNQHNEKSFVVDRRREKKSTKE
jgi:hypothetical protein